MLIETDELDVPRLNEPEPTGPVRPLYLVAFVDCLVAVGRDYFVKFELVLERPPFFILDFLL